MSLVFREGMAAESVEKICTVRNKMGLHARPAAQIVQAANRFPCDVTLEKDGQPVNGKSITVVPIAAASISTPMMLLPFTGCPSFSSVTSQGNRLAACTICAAGRACRPILLRTVQIFSTDSAAMPLPEVQPHSIPAQVQRHKHRRRSCLTLKHRLRRPG